MMLACHDSHVMWRTGTDLLFCGLCASYTSGRRCQGLLRPCARTGRSYAKQKHLTLMMEGRHPVTKEVIGIAHPLRL